MSDENKGGNDDRKELKDDPAFIEMQKAVKGISLLMQQNQASNTKMQDNFKLLMDRVGDREPERDPDPDEDAINDLDNAGLMKLVVGEISKVMKDQIGDVTKSLSATNQNISDNKIATELKDHIVNHPDFMDWKTEISVLAKENPTLSIPRLHSLVRSENPEKATELDGKYTSDEDKDTKPGFLGLMPTGGGFVDEDSGEKIMTKDEALNKAWEEVLETFPAIASAGDG